jgi:GNAT superfamily N-acetyltransferase
MPPHRWGRQSYNLRQALVNDLPELLRVKSLTWPGEAVDPHLIMQVLEDPQHTCIVAVISGQVAGFVDGFITEGPSGMRWEVDLLAVEPLHRGHRLGEALVNASCQAIHLPARALIRSGNLASQVTFARCGFKRAGAVNHLFVTTEMYTGVIAGTLAGRCIGVTTMNYTGIWLEGSFGSADLLEARRLLGTGKFELAGAVIPASQTESCQAAVRLQYQFVDEYDYWIKESIHGEHQPSSNRTAVL